MRRSSSERHDHVARGTETIILAHCYHLSTAAAPIHPLDRVCSHIRSYLCSKLSDKEGSSWVGRGFRFQPSGRSHPTSCHTPFPVFQFHACTREKRLLRAYKQFKIHCLVHPCGGKLQPTVQSTVSAKLGLKGSVEIFSSPSSSCTPGLLLKETVKEWENLALKANRIMQWLNLQLSPPKNRL